MAETTSHIYDIFIRTTPERLWDALTNGEQTSRYFQGLVVQDITTVGANYRFLTADGACLLEGKVLESVPPRKLVTTFQPRWGVDATESRVTYEIVPEDGVCRLTLRHEGMVIGEGPTESVKEGWARIFSSLKTLLESGEPLPPGGMDR